MNLKTKITAGFLALLLLLLGMGAYAYYSLQRLETSSRDALTANFYSVELGQQMLQALDRLETQPADAAGLAHFRRALAQEARNVSEPGEQQLVDSLTAASAAFGRQQGPPPFGQLRAQTHRMIRLNTAALTAKNVRASRTALQARRYLLAFTVLAALVALMFVLSVPESAVGPLHRLMQGLAHATDENYSAPIFIENDDEFGRVGRAFNRMLVQLNDYRNATTADFRAERNRAHSIVNGLDEGLVLLDGQRRIILANPVACDLLGLPAEALLDHSAAEVAVESPLFQAMLAPLDGARADANEARSGGPVLTIPRNGEDTFYRLAVQELEAFNETTKQTESVGQILTLRNVSDFQKLDQEKSNFLLTVAHELKTPLADINARLLALRPDEVAAPERQRVADGIAHHTQRLLRLADELTDVARLNAGTGVQFEAQSTPVPAVVGFATATVQAQLDQHGLTVRADLPADLPPVRADVEKTTWVLVNLLANAIRYSPPGETIVVRAVRDGDFVRLSVRDRGRGIAPEYHERIFQRFAQLPDAGHAGGAGLGLSIAREFVTTQGGRLWVESAPGAGSEFCFTLPVG
ncbi:ATP-binding protein [Hymenobacter caeli]|uniref:histidine kinase n=1 Tax=Hymenobacter caeli TaxID=2735894 RepID=A0ABX2FY03_9BACT|nr:ATP-binding protein [Hymenobacter caeli]NRT21260.1 signal transduction histidine kinase [Hymenobacter caeli]